jgi:hypothetical protein
MNALNQFIRKLEIELPEVCSTTDLMKFGIYNSPQSARLARKKKRGPAYIQMGRKVIYPKQGVIEFLKQSAHPCECS